MRRHLSILCRNLDRDRLLSTWVFRIMTLFAYVGRIGRDDQAVSAALDRRCLSRAGYGNDGRAGEECDIPGV